MKYPTSLPCWQRFQRSAEWRGTALAEIAPVAQAVLRPRWAPADENEEISGISLAQTRDFALRALQRRLKVIGLA